MTPIAAMLLLPASLLAFISQALADQSFPTALKKLSPDSNEKLFPEHLAFAPLPLSNFDVEAIHKSLSHRDDGNLTASSNYSPAFARHFNEAEGGILRRAAEALSLLEKRSSCPSGMNSCDSTGSPNKCCQEGTYCTNVPDNDVGHVACCPEGSSCGGGVGKCPSDAVSCPADLGGGCCISGYVCQGMGCVPSASATKSTVTQTAVESTTETRGPETITKTQTTVIGGIPSTVIVTLTITKTSSVEPTTETTTDIITPTDGDHSSVTGGAPFRPISSATVTDGSSTQGGCPTGFYGCLAVHGGGCCQTDRDCQTHSCPAASSTTIISNHVTIVVPATGIPATATAKCADGWFMCGKAAGPLAGCCPSGYDCGTASCFKAEASQTGEVQKKFPGDSLGAGRSQAHAWVLYGLVISCVFLLFA